jgi:hypothetical protein
MAAKRKRPTSRWKSRSAYQQMNVRTGTLGGQRHRGMGPRAGPVGRERVGRLVGET